MDYPNKGAMRNFSKHKAKRIQVGLITGLTQKESRSTQIITQTNCFQKLKQHED
jgi:hypothetical protein